MGIVAKGLAMMMNKMQKTDTDQLLKSLIVSLAVCIPSFCLSVYLMEANLQWTQPGLITTAILGLMIGNFIMVVVLEQYRHKLGALTFPALLAAIALVMLYVMTGAINRFADNLGYEWLYPVVLSVLLLSYLAIFKEKTLLMKCQLGFNGIALTVLWCLGAADKIALPF